jgi:hypothetical protein
MNKISLTRTGALLGVLGLQAFFASAAFAHKVGISAQAVCAEDGSPVINYTSTSWS